MTGQDGIEDDGACAAVSRGTALFRTGQPKLITQNFKQTLLPGAEKLCVFTVDCRFDSNLCHGDLLIFLKFIRTDGRHTELRWRRLEN